MEMKNKKIKNINMKIYFRNENNDKKVAYCIVIPFNNKAGRYHEIQKDLDDDRYSFDEFIIDKKDYKKLLLKSTLHNI